jgi:superoxide reductase
MTKLKEIYKCEICENIVEVLHVGQGELVCCGQSMILQLEKVEDVGSEKHIPVLEKQGEKVIVKVGEVPHPMEDEHYIEWIEVVLFNGSSYRVFLKPKDIPEITVVLGGGIKEIREYCNVHGLWKNNFVKKQE